MIEPSDFNPKPFWTVQQLAEFLSISRAAAYRLMDSGEIAWHAFGGTSRRVSLLAVRDYVNKTAKGVVTANGGD